MENTFNSIEDFIIEIPNDYPKKEKKANDFIYDKKVLNKMRQFRQQPLSFEFKTAIRSESIGESLHHFTYFTQKERKQKVSIIIPSQKSIFRVNRNEKEFQTEHLVKKIRHLQQLEQSEEYVMPEYLRGIKNGAIEELKAVFDKFIPLEEERKYIGDFIREVAKELYNVEINEADYTLYVLPLRFGEWDYYVKKYITPILKPNEEAIVIENKYFHPKQYSILITFKGGLK